MLGRIFELSIGTVFVRMISSRGAHFSLSMAGPLNTPCVAHEKILLAFCLRRASAVCTNVPAVSIMSSQMMTFLSAHIADDVHDFGLVGRRPPLVDYRQIRIQPLGEGAGAFDAARIGRNHRQVRDLQLLEILDQHRSGKEMIHRNIEKALDLAGMQIHGQNPVGAGSSKQIRHQLGTDRNPGLVFSILPRIAVIRHHRRDPRRRGTLEGIDHDQQFHHVVVHRAAGGLDDENVLAAHVFKDLDSRPLRR